MPSLIKSHHANQLRLSLAQRDMHRAENITLLYASGRIGIDQPSPDDYHLSLSPYISRTCQQFALLICISAHFTFGMTQLVVLNLSYNRDLKRLAMLAELPALECLHVSCSNLNDLLGEGGMKVLRRMPHLLLLEVDSPHSLLPTPLPVPPHVVTDYLCHYVCIRHARPMHHLPPLCRKASAGMGFKCRLQAWVRNYVLISACR